MVNGMSNNYWGWGLEDDEFYTRVMAAKLEIGRPTNLTTTTKDTFRQVWLQSRAVYAAGGTLGQPCI